MINHYVDDYADRAARNVHDLSPYETGAIMHYESFRHRVIMAFKKIHGQDAKLDFDVRPNALSTSWLIPGKLIYSAPTKIIKPCYDIITVLDKRLVQAISNNEISLSGLSPREFEEFVGELLKGHGYHIEITQQTHDGGYDLFGIKIDTLGIKTPVIVQCKRYNEKRKVGVSVIRELYGVQTSMNIPNAILATSSYASPNAYKFINEKIKIGFLSIADRDTLLEWAKRL